VTNVNEVILTPEQVSWFASITAITCPLGGPLSGFFTDKIGRRSTLMLLNIISIISWLVIGFSSRVDSQAFFVQLMVGRAIIGIGIGMTTAPTVMYVSEVCHAKLRGRLTLLSSPFFTAIGLLTIYLLGYCIPVSARYLPDKSRDVPTHVATFYS
jgi:MFS family permease